MEIIQQKRNLEQASEWGGMLKLILCCLIWKGGWSWWEEGDSLIVHRSILAIAWQIKHQCF